jgi:putative hydrolase of the HAD superfamily
MALKAILFDLDDTLIDWTHFDSNWEAVESPYLRGVYDYLCQTADFPHTLETYIEAYVDHIRDAWMSARSSLIAPHIGRVLVKAAVSLGVAEEVLDIDASLKAFGWGAIPGTHVFPDVIEGLTLLRDCGIHLGIVTNAAQPMSLRDVELAQHGLLEFFPRCRFAAADAGYLKPHEKIFAAALACLDASPDETIFIGDNPVADIAGAQGAGMRGIIRVNHEVKPMISGLIIPDAAINSLTELPPILDEWFPGWNNHHAVSPTDH